jgi:hypothetical protein
MNAVMDCDHLIDAADLVLDGLNPEYEPLDFARQCVAFPLQFLFNARVVRLQKWSRTLADGSNQVWWFLLPNAE